MSGDLISRKELLKKLCTTKDGRRIPETDIDNFPITITLRDIKEIVRHEPTAYDVDKVMKQLEEYKDEAKQLGALGLVGDMIEVVKLSHDVSDKHSNGWIPCSERLPENKDDVLVCWGGNNVSVGYFVRGGAGGWFFEQLAGGRKIPYEPFAWQPLPEPYQSKGE